MATIDSDSPGDGGEPRPHLPTSHRAKPHVMDAELRELADFMFDDQAREVGEMQEMLGP